MTRTKALRAALLTIIRLFRDSNTLDNLLSLTILLEDQRTTFLVQESILSNQMELILFLLPFYLKNISSGTRIVQWADQGLVKDQDN